jgi:hypothetical protein
VFEWAKTFHALNRVATVISGLGNYLKETVRRYGLDSCGSGKEPVMTSCRYGNGSLDSIKGGEFLD